MAFKNTFEIEFVATGNVTQEQYTGTFEIKLHLSPMDNVNYFAAKKALLPKEFKFDETDDASVQAENLAEVLSLLPIRVVKGPRWWGDSNFGKNLIDGDILYELYSTIMKQVVKEISDRKAKAEEQKKDLKTFVEK